MTTAEPRTETARRRQAELLVMARRTGRLDVAPTAARFGVTQETVRRDLRALESQGLVRRSYGSAFPVASGRFETAFQDSADDDAEEKNRIADAAAALLDTAQTVYIDDDHLASLVAERLSSVRLITVITGSLPAATAAAVQPGMEVLVVGGRLRPTSLSTVEDNSAFLGDLNIDLAFITAAGISVDQGVTTQDPTLAAVKASAMRAARRRIYIGTHTKFGVTGFVRFANVSDFEVLVTGSEFPAHRAARYSNLGPRMIRA